MNTQPRFAIEKTARCIAVPLVMALASCGEAPKEPDPLPPILAELEAERARLGTELKSPALIDVLRVEAARAGDETERKGVLAQLHDTDPQRQSKAMRGGHGFSVFCLWVSLTMT